MLYRAPLEEDLRPISALLFQQRIAHRIVEDGGEQVIQLQEPSDTDRAADLLKRWQSGELNITLKSGPSRQPQPARLSASWATSPVSLMLIALSVVGFLLTYVFPSPELVAQLTYNAFELRGGRPVFVESSGQPWRLITPVFLHFGWMHIVFNSLWCWDLGRRIESALGSLNLAGLFLVTALLSNTAQDMVAGPVLFGGLSGVVYGFLGFAYTAGRLNAKWHAMAPATPVMLFMVGWLVFCMSGFIEVLGFSVANTAHLAGLLSGVGIGLLFAFSHRGNAVNRDHDEGSGPA